MKKNKKLIVAIIIAFSLGVVLSLLISNIKTTEKVKLIEENKKSEEWTCAMHPQIRLPEKGKCPICGMDLIKANTSKIKLSNFEVEISSNAVKLSNIQTAEVKRGNANTTLTLRGKIKADERRLYSQSANYSGRIEKLYVNFTNDFVQKGDIIASIYSPELITAQKELFEALNFKPNNPQLVNAAKSKLENWQLSKEQIENIIQTKKIQTNLDILSEVTGNVSSLNMKLGDYVQMEQRILEVTNLDTLWVEFDAYESNLDFIKLGETIRFSVSSLLPNKKFKSEVTFIDPIIHPLKRVAIVRTEVENKNNILKPEMLVEGELTLQQNNVIIIPKTAVLWTGKRSVVYVKIPDNKGEKNIFQYKEVVLGDATPKGYIVVNGLSEGEQIVVNGAFSLDAESQLRGKHNMVNPIRKHKNEHSQQQSQQYVTNVITQYLLLKDAFVESDMNKASEHATHLVRAIQELAKNSKIQTMQLSAEVKKIVGNNDIENARRSFKDVSKYLIELVKQEESSGNWFIQHCSMTFENEGADWISNEKVIKNPYFGNKMMSCGTVKEGL